jgi:hypothetical protein
VPRNHENLLNGDGTIIANSTSHSSTTSQPTDKTVNKPSAYSKIPTGRSKVSCSGLSCQLSRYYVFCKGAGFPAAELAPATIKTGKQDDSVVQDTLLASATI